jgi:hypothetical protein
MSGIHSLLASPAGVQYNTKFFCASVLPDIERSSATASAERRFEASIWIWIMHQLIMQNGRDKKLPEPKPTGLPIELILQIVHPTISSCLVT